VTAVLLNRPQCNGCPAASSQSKEPAPHLQRAIDKAKKTAFRNLTRMTLKAKFLQAFENVLQGQDK
jgi:hypothetical protein